MVIVAVHIDFVGAVVDSEVRARLLVAEQGCFEKGTREFYL